MQIRVEGYALPGRFGARDVHVGIQVRQEVVQLVPADVPEAVWTTEASLITTPDGAYDLRGPGIHGKRGDRFLYLSWREVDHGMTRMFRRLKIMLDAVDDASLVEADQPGRALVARVGLTAKDGTPRCAAVRPPDITWSVRGFVSA